MRKMCLVLGVAALLPLLGSRPAAAQGAGGMYTMAQRCVIANEDCFVMRASAEGLTPEQRLDKVNERLAYIIGYESLAPRNIRMVDRGHSVEILVGRSSLVTVTANDARANGTRNIQGLARVWLRNLREALPQSRPGPYVALAETGTRVAQR